MWNHAVKFAGQLDHAMGVGRRAFGALQPALQDFGGERVNRAVMQGFKAYDQGRADTIGAHHNLPTPLNRVGKAVAEIEPV